MNPVKIILGLIPFALFTLLAGFVPVGWAALIGAVAAAVVVLSDLRRGVKTIPVLAVGVLAIFSVLGFVGSTHLQLVLADYGRGLATLILALVILATVPFAPFTAAYARETVPEQYWTSEKFRSENRRISLAWGLTVLVMAAGHLAAESLAIAGAAVPPLPFLLNWALPILAIIATVNYTKRTTGKAGQSA